MKHYLNTQFISVLVVIIIVSTGCKKTFLDEYNPANRTTDNYYTTPAGYESLVTACYPLLRDITQLRVPYLNGTDLFASGGWLGTVLFPSQTTQTGSAWDTYDITMNSTLGELQTTWDLLYREINRCNAAVERAPAVVNMVTLS